MKLHGGFKETIVFELWETKSIGGLILKFYNIYTYILPLFFYSKNYTDFVGSCVALFFISIFYELIKSIREILARLQVNRRLIQLET